MTRLRVSLFRRKYFILTSAFLLSGLTACGQRTRQDLPQHSQSLIVCPGAKETHWGRFGRTEQLTYQVEVEYPASHIVSCISDQLTAAGWKPLEEDYWNPGLPSSHVTGWTQFADTIVQPQATVDQWAASMGERIRRQCLVLPEIQISAWGQIHSFCLRGLCPRQHCEEDAKKPAAADAR